VVIIFFPLEIRSSIPAGLDELPTVCNKAYFPEDLSAIWTRDVPLLFEQKALSGFKTLTGLIYKPVFIFIRPVLCNGTPKSQVRT
jgi:hypothetical protein